MKTLDLYLIRAYFRFFFLLALVLALLFGFFEFVAQLENVGRGNYDFLKALAYVFLTSGGRLYDLLPIISLLAGLLALGNLGERQELLAMQAAGMSRGRIGMAVLSGLFLLLFLFLLLEETLFPRAEHKAWLLRARALATRGITPYGQGFWAKEAENFLRVEKVLGKGLLAGVEIFFFDEEGRLKRFVFAEKGEVHDDHWLLFQVAEQEIKPQQIEERHFSNLKIKAFLNVGQVENLTLPAEFLSLRELWRSQKALQEGGQNAYRYALLFWQRIFVLPTAVFMLFLALGFVLCPLRERGKGLRVGAGALFGLFVYLGEQVLAHLGLVFEWSPFLMASIPAFFVFLLALWRWRSL